MSQSAQQPLSIYLHWPFCGAKCPYCDFNSHVRPQVDETRWVNALLASLDYWAERTPNTRVETIFWGGGTPSLMRPGSIETILNRIALLWPMAEDCEITMEANPTTHEKERFAGFRAAGVNRLSLGVQSFRQDALDFLGRTYSVADAENALTHIAATFPRFSFDLIYALPDQTEAEWRRQLDHALGFGSAHISLYQLTIEPGTRFYQWMQSGKISPLADEATADLYDITVGTLEKAGLLRYEVSNFAPPKHVCRHNLVYWSGGQWIGIGPGAHARLGKQQARTAICNLRSPEKWLQAIENKENGVDTETRLSSEETATEFVLTALRTADGIDMNSFEDVCGQPLTTFVEPDRLQQLVSNDLAEYSNNRYKLKQNGMNLLDSIVRFLM